MYLNLLLHLVLGASLASWSWIGDVFREFTEMAELTNTLNGMRQFTVGPRIVDSADQLVNDVISIKIYSATSTEEESPQYTYYTSSDIEEETILKEVKYSISASSSSSPDSSSSSGDLNPFKERLINEPEPMTESHCCLGFCWPF